MRKIRTVILYLFFLNILIVGKEVKATEENCFQAYFQDGNGKYSNATKILTVDLLPGIAIEDVVVQVIMEEGTFVWYPEAGQSTETGTSLQYYFEDEGDYQVIVQCAEQEAYLEPFTIDRTKPEIHIFYENEDNSGYTQHARKASIQIREEHFAESGLQLYGDGQAQIIEWQHDGELHIVDVIFSQEQEYRFGITCTDLAGNTTNIEEIQNFSIDHSAPEIAIKGIAPDSANRGKITPIVEIRDENIAENKIHISVTTGRGKEIPVNPEIQRKGDIIGFLLADLSEQPDDIYLLSINATDLAGNESHQTIRYSLNRNGSTYDVSRIQDFLKNPNCQYEKLEDLKIIEMNVDEIEQVTPYITHNGKVMTDQEKMNQFFEVVPVKQDMTGYMNEYVFHKELFEEEGLYHISLYTKDKAGNEIDSMKDVNITFFIDQTAPIVVFNGITSDQFYREDKRECNVLVKDNGKLKKTEIFVYDQGGEVVQKWDHFENGEVQTIVIESANAELSFGYDIEDMAGNCSKVGIEGKEGVPSHFWVTKSILIRCLQSKWIIVLATGVFLLCIIALRAVRRRAII